MLSGAKLARGLLFRTTKASKSQRRSLHQSRSLRAGPMMQHQHKLPKIPVPELKDTLQRYLVAVEPLITPQQMEKTKKAVAEFESNPAWGPYLQQQLLELDKLTSSSYIEGFWDTMYLEIRDPIVTNVNPGFILASNPSAEQDPTKLASLLQTSTQIAKTATLLEAAAKFVSMVKNETLPTDMEKTTPLDMSQYPKLFSSTRLPGYSRDTFHHVPEKNAKHVLVMIQGNYFTIDILDAQGNGLSANAIASQLLSITEQASLLGNQYHTLGPLTGQDRTNWSWNYSHLAGLGKNREVLDKIESALFAVCLESSAPGTTQEAGQVVLHGPDSRNRYFDKSIQLIVFQDGRTGLNFEHTGFDGHTVLTFVSHIQGYQADLTTLKPAKIASTPAPHLSVTLDAKLLKAIEQAQSDFEARAAQLSGSFMNWQEHGKKFITGAGFSPDAYVQMAFQLTQKRLFNRFVSTYESSNVKHFNRGRTECVRSATSDAKHFVDVFDSPSVSAEQKLEALNKAVNRHVSEMKKSKEGKLIDRHLQVLNWLSVQQLQRQAGYKRPTLFTDEAFGAHFASILSTSNCGSPALDHFSFGPVTGSGFGLGYMILDNSIPVSVTSFQGKAALFANGLRKALADMQAFIQANGKKKL